MKVAHGLLALLVGRSVSGGGARLWWIVLLLGGYIAGAKLGIPDPFAGIVDSSLEQISNVIGNLLPGDES
ncbi:hypothetical protein [Parvularcula sp. LCG005]|uniref:hypothetical protein n=1 Tax=Parvularcula sp. LCG005 TaxID=3078805 RepID=UPI002943CB2A|nr:hypothetical protein [Parvularcula sp. LCG005]WOI54622.1 hypothetical protein RUI03_06385 [Parvularcula sp. LCG005]